MVAYTKDEMVGITELSKSLSGFVGKLKSQTLNKIAIIKNNVPEAVVVPIERYERLEEMEKLFEQIAIADIIEKRVHSGKIDERFDLEEYHQGRIRSRTNV